MCLIEFLKYKKELDQRVQVIQSGLGGVGIRSALLNTQQIIELLYGVYNPEDVDGGKQKYNYNFDDWEWINILS